MPTKKTDPKKDARDEYVHVRIPAKLKGKLQAIAKGNYKTLSAYCIESMIEKARRDGHEL